jgi:uncharacterized membrane-anchored protein YhcB (DUF1043 family)
MGDWNWFLSSVAQSIAAVVGIMAGFITTRLVTNQADFSRHRARTQEILHECERLVDEAARRQFAWFSNWENERAYNYVEERLMAGSQKSAVELYKRAVFSPFYPAAELLAEIKRRMANPETTGRLGTRYTEDTFQKLKLQLDPEREKINAVLASCKHQARVASDHVAQITSQPESSSVIQSATIATLLLFYTGVIYPLSFLPMPSNIAPRLSFWSFFAILASLQGVILTICTSIFTVACAAALRFNASLRHSREEIEDLHRFASDTAYSSYFKVLRENEKLLAAEMSAEA